MLRDIAARLFLTLKGLGAPVILGVAGAIFDAQGRVLLVRQSYMPGWRLPGGGVGRGEAPDAALLRELAEEVGMSGGRAGLVSIHSRPMGWMTNVILLYRVEGAAIAFRPNLEVREIRFADPAAPPDGTTAATRRRLAELGGAAPSPCW